MSLIVLLISLFLLIPIFHLLHGWPLSLNFHQIFLTRFASRVLSGQVLLLRGLRIQILDASSFHWP